MISLRQYQTEALETSRAAYDKGTTRQLLELSTGLGKTAGIAMQIPAYYPELFERNGGDGGLIFVVHRKEIVRSTAAAFKAFHPERWIGIEMGDTHAIGDEDIIVVSVDSLGRLMSNRVYKYGHRKPGILLFDEAHHLTIDGTWDNVATFFGVGSDPSTRFRLANGMSPLSILLTATPDRHDKQSLAPFIDEIDGEFRALVKYDYQWGVRNGYLCDIVGYRMTASGQERELDVLLRAVRDFAPGHQTLVFAPSVADSAELVATLNDRGICRAAHVDANTDPDERETAFNAFKRGDLDLLSNYAIFTEGVDLPATSLIIDASETQSRALFAQKVGRASRTHPDARIDDYDTAEQRIEAIAKSPKPYATYVSTFNATNLSLTLHSVLTNDARGISQDGAKVVSEIIDRIELFETERPAVPIRSIKSLDDIDVLLQQMNIWTRTIYNENLHAMSPLCWSASKDALSLYLPFNPWLNGRGKGMPVVVSFHPVRNADGKITEYRQRITQSGGWNSAKRRPQKAVQLKESTVQNLQKAVNVIDAEIKARNDESYSALIRRPNDPAEEAQLTYIKNARIDYVSAGMNASVADLLINDHRCRRVLGL